MTQTLELGKGELVTIETFYFEIEDDCFYETERCEDIDTVWYEQMGVDLDSYVLDLCKRKLDEEVRVSVVPRRWGTIVDGEVYDYGDDCLGREDYIWTKSHGLLSEDEYLYLLKNREETEDEGETVEIEGLDDLIQYIRDN